MGQTGQSDAIHSPDACASVVVRLTIRLRDREVVLHPGELFVVPRNVEHQPFAEEETHLLLIEPSGTPTAAPHRTI